MGRCNPQPLPFWSLPTPESPISPNVLHTASTKAQAARTPNDERNEDRQSSTCQREGDWQEVEGGRRRSKEVEGSRGRSEPGRAKQPDRRSQRHRRNRSQRAGHGKRITGIASPRHRAQVNKKALAPGSISTTGRTQVSEKGPGSGTHLAASQRRAVPAAGRPSEPQSPSRRA